MEAGAREYTETGRTVAPRAGAMGSLAVFPHRRVIRAFLRVDTAR